MRDNGNWDSGTGIGFWNNTWERGKMKRAKIERKARRVAERPEKDNGLRTIDFVNYLKLIKYEKVKCNYSFISDVVFDIM